MKKQILTLGSFVVVCSLHAQEVISTQGDSYSNSTGNVSFTVGEVVTATATDGTYTLTQGFHQTNWNFLGLEDYQPDVEATVYPNPVAEALNIRMEAFTNVRYILTDANGKVVASDKLTTSETAIAVTDFAPGAYTLQLLMADNSLLKTFKLVKKH